VSDPAEVEERTIDFNIDMINVAALEKGPSRYLGGCGLLVVHWRGPHRMLVKIPKKIRQ
jgi:hypothetical protein